MFKPMTYLDLCMAMKTGAVVEIDRSVGIINAIEREDGSGRSFNVKMRESVTNERVTKYFRE